MTTDMYGVDETAWHALFQEDDARTARKLLATQSDTQVDWIRKMALAATPHPNAVLDILFTDAPPTGAWLYDLTTSSRKYPTPWERILDWLVAREGSQKTSEHALVSLQAGLDACETYIHYGFEAQGLGGLFDNAMGRWPGLAKTLAENTTNPALFFELAWEKERDSWLDDSGVDLTWLLGRVMEQKISVLQSKRKGDDLSFEAWIAQNPQRMAAWTKLEAQDQETQSLFEDWKAIWVPEDWGGSPLKRHCIGKDLDFGDPLDHPLFWNVKADDRLAAKRALGEHIFTMAMAQSHHDEEKRLRLACGALRDVVRATRNEPRATPLLLLPASHLAMDLTSKARWTETWWLDQERIPDIQALLHDKRMLHHVGRCDGNVLVKALLGCLSWRHWRTPENESLLDLWERSSDKPAMRKDVLLRLAKQAPELLLSQGTGDLRMIERLDVPAATRALAKQAMLGQSVDPENQLTKPSKRTGRSM